MRKSRKIIISLLIVLMVGLLLSINVFSNEKVAGSTQEYIIKIHRVKSCNITKEIEEYIGVHYIVMSRAIKRAEGEDEMILQNPILHKK